MRVATSEQMRESDRRTIAAGTPGEILMERAGARVVELIEREFAPLNQQRVVIFCGKGNNGGDGLVVARLLKNRVAALQVVSLANVAETAWDREATIVIDALFGTGFRGNVEGRAAQLIQALNSDFEKAKIVAVDIPSAMQVRADYTVTFAAPKAEMLMSPDAQNIGKLVVADIGIPEEFLPSDLFLSEAQDFSPLFHPRRRDAHKGDFGHVLIVGGAPGKTGAAAMAGLAAARMGAGWVTVACSDDSRLPPELMWNPLDKIELERKTVLAIGPGLGMQQELVTRLLRDAHLPTVIDADGLNSIAGTEFRGRGVETVLTPHPGEMARLTGMKVEDRLVTARAFARERTVCLVLKGYRTLIALPDGRVWINPTGSPAMAKAGSGDILTGLIAGLIAQHPRQIDCAVRAAVWLHGRAGELAAEELTENCVIATDLLKYLPAAITEIVHLR
jgi:ADP-dependent NAD(P)H-hydrate dehydratase / NAD(P)H-hydrate epimerase